MRAPLAIQKGTRVLVSLWDSLMFGYAGTRVLMLVLVLARTVWSRQKGTRVLISLWDSLMLGRVPGTRPNNSKSHSEMSTRVPFCIAVGCSGRAQTMESTMTMNISFGMPFSRAGKECFTIACSIL